MNPQLILAIAAGKGAGLLSRTLGRGGGTTLPGTVARRLYAHTLRALSASLPDGVTLVAGTNGKTTTARMLAAILAADGRPPLHNRAGANLVSGLTATAVAGSDLAGRPLAAIGLFETDEAAFPQALAETAPRLVLLHNLFRDQLDRYGEVDTIAQTWRAALATLPATATVLLNADDPLIASLGDGLAARVRFYGIEDTRHVSDATSHIADSQFCRRCGAPYVYSARFYGHIGHYACRQCGLARPAPHYALTSVELDGTSGSRLTIALPHGELALNLPLPGLYNAANALAAAAAASELGAQPPIIQTTLASFASAFGRVERIDAGGRPLLLALIKNPIGASETVRMLAGAAPLQLLVVINDRDADGTDVSWLWDADFETLAGLVAGAVVSGTRAADMAVRLKYAGVAPEQIVLEPELAAALDAALAALPPGQTLYALPTYTAMLELRAELVRRGWAKPFWED